MPVVVKDATEDMQPEHMFLSDVFSLRTGLLSEGMTITPMFQLRYCFESISDETACKCLSKKKPRSFL